MVVQGGRECSSGNTRCLMVVLVECLDLSCSETSVRKCFLAFLFS